MSKAKSSHKLDALKAEVAEMRRLYDEEGLTLREIGSRFGMTRQAVQLRFVAAGIPRRSHYNPAFINARIERTERVQRILDDHRDEIVRMYEVEKVPLSKIARHLGISHPAVRAYLVKCGITIRSRDSLRKFPELGKLKVGESLLLPIQTRKYIPHLTYYFMAKTYKIRVSVRTIDDKTFRVTRVE